MGAVYCILLMVWSVLCTGVSSACAPGCLNCLGKDCFKCSPDYFFDHHRCHPCTNISNCELCSRASHCTKCKPGYHAYNGDCYPCSYLHNCISCSDFLTCDTCDAGFFLQSPSFCSRCANNCAVCRNSTQCSTCKPGFYGSTCAHACSEHCIDLECTSTGCIKGCKDGFYRVESSCVKCSSLCKNGNCDSDNGSCTEGCSPVDRYGTRCETSCNGTIPFCSRCDITTSSVTCALCQSGYSMNSTSTCIPCSGNCKEGSTCRQGDGACAEGCKTGWGGARCTEVCPVGCETCPCEKTESLGDNIISDDQPGVNTGSIVGGVTSGVAVLIIITIAVVFLLVTKRRNTQRERQGANVISITDDNETPYYTEMNIYDQLTERDETENQYCVPDIGPSTNVIQETGPGTRVGQETGPGTCSVQDTERGTKERQYSALNPVLDITEHTYSAIIPETYEQCGNANDGIIRSGSCIEYIQGGANGQGQYSEHDMDGANGQRQ